MKRGLRITCLLLLLSLLLACTVSANSPPNDEFTGRGGFHWQIFLAFICGSVALTVLIEWLVSLLFRLKAASVIIVTNVISQLIMHGAFLLATTLALFGIRSIYLIAILEVAVLFIEWIVYCIKLTNHSRGKLFLYTLTANLLSLAAGSLVFQLI